KRSILGGQPNRSVAGRAVAELIVQADAHDMIVQVAGGAGESVGGGAKDRCGQKTAADERACDRYSLELGIQEFRSHAQIVPESVFNAPSDRYAGLRLRDLRDRSRDDQRN